MHNFKKSRSSFLFIFALTAVVICSCTKTVIILSPQKSDTIETDPPVNPALKTTVSTVAGQRNSLYGQIIPTDLALDQTGNLYISDPYTNTLSKLGTDSKLSLVAGKYDLYHGGFADGKGSDAKFNYQQGIANDAFGNVYVCDFGNHRIRKVTSDGIVTTLAGSGVQGTKDGNGTEATFSSPLSLKLGPDGNLYLIDSLILLRQITPQGKVTTIANFAADKLSFSGITINSNGDFYLVSPSIQRIYKYSRNKVLSLFAGSGEEGSENGLGAKASFKYPTGLITDKTGNLYVSERGYHLIRKITPEGMVSTLAGNGKIGADDGLGTKASFNFPGSMVIDASGNILVAEDDNRMVRKITPAGMVSTIYGKPDITGSVAALSAVFNQPTGVITDASNNIYVADAGFNLIRKIDQGGNVSVFAGNGSKGDSDGSGTRASFNNPTGLTIDASNNIYVADYGNNELRKITAGKIVTGMPLFVSANGASGPNNNPSGVCIGLNGDIFYTNNSYNTICVIQGPTISTFSDGVYNDQPYGKFYAQPFGLTVDKDGNVYVADTNNHRIMKVDKNGRETIVAGASSLGNFPLSGHNDGTGMAASFNHPKGIAVDAAGNMYVADTDNNLIRKITTNGIVTTIAGLAATPGDADGDAKVATFDKPCGITVNAAGTVLYVADTGNSLIRKIALK